jgi:hypothetical protein
VNRKELTVPNNRVRWIVGAIVSIAAAGSSVAAMHESQDPQSLVDVVREATAAFRDPEVAMAAGYVPKPFCVSGPNQGAMGVHFANPALVTDGKLDPQTPETLVYESKDGRLRLVAAEYIVFKADWEAQGNKQTPMVLGQLMNFIAAPNRFGFPDFYELHVWAWKDNPFGTFVDWNPRVSCAEHSPGA